MSTAFFALYRFVFNYQWHLILYVIKKCIRMQNLRANSGALNIVSAKRVTRICQVMVVCKRKRGCRFCDSHVFLILFVSICFYATSAVTMSDRTNVPAAIIVLSGSTPNWIDMLAFPAGSVYVTRF